MSEAVCAPRPGVLERRAVYTDTQTWSGQVHPLQALRQYQEKMGIRAKLIADRNRYISVLAIEQRKVTRWRNYLDPVAVLGALG